MKQIVTLLLILMAVSSQAQTAIKIEDVNNHIGDSVKFTGKIFSVKQLTNAKGAPTFINLGAAYPNQLLTIVIWQAVKDKMSFDPSQEKYIGGMARVTGKLELYKGKPQIVITDPKQFDIIYDEEVKLEELPKVKQ
jgi:hypothetical protein